MYKCSEIARAVASDEYQEAGFFRRWGIRLHLALCRDCSRYDDQLKALGKAMRSAIREVPPSQVEAVKKRIRDKLRP